MKARKFLSVLLALATILSCICVSAVADNSADIDLTDSTSTIEQKYTLKTDTTYKDAYKVKVEWVVSTIDVSRDSTKKWNLTTMEWDDVTDVTADEQTATFTFTNYSSQKIVGKVSFAASEGLTDTLKSATFMDGKTDVAESGVTVDTMVNTDHSVDSAKKATPPNKTITATLIFNQENFADASNQDTATTYGIYTVKIEAVQ